MHVVITEVAKDPDDAIDRCASLVPQERPTPGPREVIVEVRSASVGWVDLLMACGQYQHLPKPPYTPGLEYAGVIAARGAEAAVEIGAPVLIDGFIAGPRSLGAYPDGGWAQWARAPIEAVRPIPDGLDFDQACNLLGSYETAYHCLIARGRLAKGETVLILGASGATGIAAVHVAKRVGATVIASGRSAAKLEVVAAQGADHVIAAGELRARVKELTGGRGLDVVYDGVGGDASLEAMRCVRFGARYLIVGWAATPIARDNPNRLPTNLMMMKGLDVLGCPTVISTVHDPSIRPPRLAWILEAGFRPHVSHRFPLAQYREAMRARLRGDVIGGCVLHPL